MELGPAVGDVLVKTFREGVAARVGHDLVLEVTRWTAVVEGEAVRFTADPTSLDVREARNGLKPLTGRDRRDIRGNLDAKVLEGRPIAFTGRATPGGASGSTFAGELSIGGAVRPVSASLERTPGGRLRGTIRLRQSDYGITPYKGLMGALKVRDEVEIVIDVPAPAGRPAAEPAG